MFAEGRSTIQLASHNFAESTLEPLLFKGHLYSGDTSIQGTQNLVLKKRSHVTSIEGALLFRGKKTLFLSSETRVQPPFREHVLLNAQKVSDHKNN